MPVPLFITRQSLSSKTAIGVQTKLLLRDFPQWRHLYWSGTELLTLDVRSTPIESPPICRFMLFKGNSFPARVLRGIGLSWWANDAPKPRLSRWLRETLRNEVSVVYLSPLEIKDARRMEALARVIDRPFVVHLQDLLDKDMLASEPFRWLVEHARHVFCISREICEYIAPLARASSVLWATRPASQHRATSPSAGEPLRIALTGNCGSYSDGIVLLNDALKRVKAQAVPFRLVYLGGHKLAKSWMHLLDEPVEISGFIEADDERDRQLARCHVGFLPGPLAPPENDPRSRYSIPIRVLDFMTIGLPVAGAVHPNGATGRYLREFGLENCAGLVTAEALALRILSLADAPTWLASSEASVRGFAAARQDTSALAQWMAAESPVEPGQQTACGERDATIKK